MTLTRRQTLSLGTAALAAPLLPSAFTWSAQAQEDSMAEPDMLGDELSIYPISHASLALVTSGLTIYADPVGNAGMYEGLPPADIILVTHEHGDHYNAELLAALTGENTQLVTNPAVHGMLPGDLQAKSTALANGESGTIMDLAIDAIPAYNTTPDRLNYHPEGRDNGYVFSLGGQRVYIAGDTEDVPAMRALTGIDLAFVPMLLPFTMSVEQAASAVNEFAPGVVYPYHYRDSDIEQFKALVDEAGGATEVRFGPWYA